MCVCERERERERGRERKRERENEGERGRGREYLVSDDGAESGPEPESHVGVVVYIDHHVALSPTREPKNKSVNFGAGKSHGSKVMRIPQNMSIPSSSHKLSARDRASVPGER